MNKNKKKIRLILSKVIIFTIVSLLITFISIKIWSLVESLKDESKMNQILTYINSIGYTGIIFCILLQVIQIVIAFIPGEPFEIIIGLIYGGIGGLFICLAGVVLGTIIVYYIVKYMRNSIFKVLIPEYKFKKYKFLNDKKRLDFIIFILFFIPGTPKDVLIYFVPFTPMNPIKFFIISSLARTPSIISSTVAGNAIKNGNWAFLITIFLVMGSISIICILKYDRIISFFKNK